MMSFPVYFAAFLAFSCMSDATLLFDESLLVETTYGKIRGVDLDQSYGFLGVPFGKPPLNDLRFASPQPPDPWNDVYAANKYGTGCIQKCVEPPEGCPTEISEDCLYLNIFVPKSNSTELKPVFIFMHGGNFRDGAGGVILYDGRFLAEVADIIIVTINYRLEAFGWLWLGNLTDPANGIESRLGNFGFQDQRLAFQFVQDNIEQFGGDPKRVTIGGQSAGAQSAGLHLLDDRSDHLFQQTIMFSNPFALPYKLQEDALKLSTEFATSLGCPPLDLDCMRAATAEDVLAASKEAASKVINPQEILQIFEPWNPVVGEGSLPPEPMEAYYQGLNQQKPSMMGSLTEEGVLYIYAIFTSELRRVLYRALLQLIVPDPYVPEVRDLYPPDFLARDQREPLSDITTDYIFGCCTINVSRTFNDNNMTDVYHYILDAAWSFEESWTVNYSQCYGRVCHAGDLPYIFRTGPLANITYTEQETNLINDMSAYIGNFFHTGNPNKPATDELRKTQPDKLPYWPKIGEKPGHWYSLYYHLCGTKVYTDYAKERCQLWDRIGYYGIAPLNFLANLTPN